MIMLEQIWSHSFVEDIAGCKTLVSLFLCVSMCSLVTYLLTALLCLCHKAAYVIGI